MSILTKLSKSTLRIALLLSVFTGLVATSHAESAVLSQSLRGKYTVTSATVSSNGFSSAVKVKKVSIFIGKTGLNALTEVKINSIITENGCQGVTAVVTSKALKKVTVTASGTIQTKFGTVNVHPETTGTVILNSTGIKVTLNIVGDLDGTPVIGTAVVKLKKQ